MVEVARHAVGFVAGFALLFLAANGLTAHLNRDPAAEKYARLYAAGPKARTQLWGTSHVLHGLDPCGLAGDVENMAFSAATPPFYRAWYAEWRRHNPPPARVLFGLDTTVFRALPWARTFAQDSGYWPFGPFLAHLVAGDLPAEPLLLNRVPLIRHRAAIQDAVARGGPSPYVYVWDGACRGFVPLLRRDRPRPAQAARAPVASRGAFMADGSRLPDDPAMADALRALLGELRRDGVAVEAFQPPYQGRLAERDLRANRLLGEVLAAHAIPFANFNAELASDLNARRDLYVDATHLNPEGARAFTAAFGRRFARSLRGGGG